MNSPFFHPLLSMTHVEDVTPAESVTRLPFKALGMRTGMALQTRRLVEGASKKESQFFGSIESKGVMVGPMGPDGVSTGLEEGEVCVVRGFTGQYEFSFLSKVLQTFEKPFAYALLAYPTQVDARRVRQSMRTKTSWPTQVQLSDNRAASDVQHLDVVLVDLSVQGAMVEAPTALGAIGDLIGMQMRVQIEESPALLNVTARICHNNKAALGVSFFVGLAFKDVNQHDKLLLHYLTQNVQAAPT